ncbi:MAG: DUF2306 domain-containing protein [Alphaproteobacteria bacterium]|jgi:uncharacterized membrane protein|nr:DUF2306 domain-containing protein [Alphaproteobacteria bacterium]
MLAEIAALDHSLEPAVTTLHSAAALLALVLGPVLLVLPKGTVWHRHLGRVAGLGLVVTAVSAFGIFADSDLFPILHGLAAWTLVCVVQGLRAVRRGDAGDHGQWMGYAWLGLVLALTGRMIGLTPGGPVVGLVVWGVVPFLLGRWAIRRAALGRSDRAA